LLVQGLKGSAWCAALCDLDQFRLRGSIVNKVKPRNSVIAGQSLNFEE